ncbi:MAG TPA: EthD domain-containing protein [Acidimicrobiales bacterium]|nr:EthD domain-containing protein [Acidimicrobiales bacterium]
MIKRIRFATRRRDVAPGAFAAAWPAAVAAVAQAPAGVRPARVAVCTTLAELTGPGAKHDGIGFEWFADAGHLARFESWLHTAEGRSSLAALAAVAAAGASPVIVADECVLRGAGWLGQRWRDGGDKLKHMAIALRAAGLSAAEFSERWRHHAGRVGGPGGAPATVIPEGARGLAYVQDHPRPRPAGDDWAYDALNEVWFDDVEGLRDRIAWFRENVPADGDDGLVRRSWFVAAREQVVLA